MMLFLEILFTVINWFLYRLYNSIPIDSFDEEQQTVRDVEFPNGFVLIYYAAPSTSVINDKTNNTAIIPLAVIANHLCFLSLLNPIMDRAYKTEPVIINIDSNTMLTDGNFHRPIPSSGRCPRFPGSSGKSARCTNKSSSQWLKATDPITRPPRLPHKRPAKAPAIREMINAPRREWV